MDFRSFVPDPAQIAELLKTICLPSPTISWTIRDSFEALQAGDTAKSEKQSRIAMDAIWEQLNIGHWKDVRVEWRWAYYLVATCRALSMVMSNTTDGSLKVRRRDSDAFSMQT